MLKQIRNEIERQMRVTVTDAGEPEASFCFPPEFSGFQGHFPGKAVLPGACQLQCLRAFLEHLAAQPLEITTIVLAKYLQPVLPGETIRCRVSGLPETVDGSFLAKGKIFREGELVAEIRLQLAPLRR